ncbi:HEAT repeat domain-containing protein [Streptomyces sp. AD55]|uniref:HEAT repeat domain-containing protein n=1 Tax=Streptomyces sp. AD55 TaxID=3242895 RepID=UPI0035292422
MTEAAQDTHTRRALRGLEHDDASVRLRVALAIGSSPDPAFVGPLVGRCAVEPDFSVREMLTWALTRHAGSATVPALLDAVRSGPARARSQALHTLSKIGDRRAWPALTPALLSDVDDEVARSAWRAAVVLVPEGGERELAAGLATQLGRGGTELRLSLSRALIALGPAMEPVLDAAASAPDPGVREHAIATRRLWLDPDAGFAYAVEEAKRVVALGGAGGTGAAGDASGASDAAGDPADAGGPGGDGGPGERIASDGASCAGAVASRGTVTSGEPGASGGEER